MNQHAAVRTTRDTSQDGPETANVLQEFRDDEHWLHRWLLPHQEMQVVAQSASKGVFIPWPLLAILVTLAVVLVSGLVTLEVQVSNLSTTLLLRDGDHARQVGELKAEMVEIKGKNEQLAVYIHDDREKLVEIKTKLGVK